jgi:hypothetical protein
MGRKSLWDELREAVYEHLEASEQPHLRILGDQYVEAFRAGAKAREMAEANPFATLKSGRVVANPMWEVHDREVRRGIQLAKVLELNKPRPAKVSDPFEALGGLRPASLAERRRQK